MSFYHYDVVGAKLHLEAGGCVDAQGTVVTLSPRLVELHLRFHGYGGG